MVAGIAFGPDTRRDAGDTRETGCCETGCGEACDDGDHRAGESSGFCVHRRGETRGGESPGEAGRTQTSCGIGTYD